MLWYKAWLETRSRFLIALIGITAICSRLVFHGDKEALYFTGISWYNGVLNSANNVLVLTWIAAVSLLAMGGLLREKSSGLSAFTLTLPVARTRLIAIRIVMGLVQSVILGIVPWIAMYLIDNIFGKTHSVSQALFRVMLILGGGWIFFALAILVSSVIEGEYTAPTVCFGLIIVITVALSEPPLRAYNPWVFMTGSQYFSRPSMLLVGPIPWMQVAANLVVTVTLLLLAVRSIRKRDLT